MGYSGVSLPARNYSILGMQVSSLIAADTYIAPNGAVKGSLPRVEGFVEFNKSNTKEQEGYYLPLLLTEIGTNMTLKKNGSAAKNKQNMPFDPEIVFRVEGPDTTFEIEVDGKSIITLSFKDTNFM